MSRDQNCLPDNLIDLYADYFIDSSRNHDIDTVYDIVSEMYNNHLDQGDEFMERLRNSELIEMLDSIELGPAWYYNYDVYNNDKLVGRIINKLKDLVFISYSGVMGETCPYESTFPKINWGQRPEDDITKDMFIDFDYKVRSNYFYETLTDLYNYVSGYIERERT